MKKQSPGRPSSVTKDQKKALVPAMLKGYPKAVAGPAIAVDGQLDVANVANAMELWGEVVGE